jgi:hypothetical protein
MFQPPRGQAVVGKSPISESGVRVPKLAHLLARFPDRELAIHRVFARDDRFRELCEDFEDASNALEFWEAAGSGGEVKAGDYRGLLAELEVELLERLEGSR